MEKYDTFYLLGLILALALWTWQKLRKIRADHELDLSDLRADMNDRLNKKIAELAARTPTAHINEDNEVVLTYKNVEIFNYDLKKKK